MNIHTYFNGRGIAAYQINIKSDETLQAIQDNFECATTLAAEQELIVDCIQFIESEAKDKLREILKLPNYIYIPSEGYLVFWKR